MVQVPSEIADRLYAVPPETFIAERNSAAAQAGDGELATAIGKLRKPTVAAWLVNLLALRRPDLVTELAELAAQLRAAQRDLRGDELRELSAQRRAAVGALVAEARTLAVAEQPELAGAKLPLGDVESTLTAALSDEEVAAQVRTGRLQRTVAYTGFGEVPRPQLRLVTNDAEPTGGSRGAEEALAEARTALKEADAELERATAAEQDGARDLAEVEAALAELERRRAGADEELGRRKLARKAAERATAAARRQVGEAQALLEQTNG